jgi:Ran GTPase-activating protein (RanGAP) involved in mRNA processing and transport
LICSFISFILFILLIYIFFRASLVVRNHLTKNLNLSRMGIGNKLGSLLADSLRDLPMVHSINVSDNNLTDEGLAPLLEAVIVVPNIRELDLGSNTIGPRASIALSKLLSATSCPLQTLKLVNADVDDYECTNFAMCMKNNSNLTELDLSNNKIGSAEALNTVRPDLTTGAEALAELLSSRKSNLQILNLGWNMIRLDSAVALAQSLSANQTLTHLDLSSNGIGREGGEQLGSSIVDNHSIKTLLLENNGIDSRACFVLCMGK